MNPPQMGQNTGITDITRRVRLTEESLSNLRRKSDLDSQTQMSEIKDLRNDVQTIYSELDQVKRQMRDFQSQMLKFIQEFRTVAKRDEVDTLKKYVDMWNPMSFVTQKDVTNIIKHELRDHTPRPVERSKPVEKPVKKPVANVSAVTHVVSPEQKRQISEFVNSHPDIQNALANNPKEFIQMISQDEKTVKLFSGVNVTELSQKLRKALGIRKEGLDEKLEE